MKIEQANWILHTGTVFTSCIHSSAVRLTLENRLENSWMDNRGLYALYTPTTSRIHVVVVNPFNNREIAIAQLERQFRDAVRNQSQSNADTSELACKVSVAKLKSECIVQYQ